jgi:LiaI-LiaF-like transmembrane region
MTGPLILIVLGVLFLLNNLYPDVYPFSRIWPVILVVIGLAKVLESIAQRSRGEKPPSGKESE